VLVGEVLRQANLTHTASQSRSSAGKMPAAIYAVPETFSFSSSLREAAISSLRFTCRRSERIQTELVVPSRVGSMHFARSKGKRQISSLRFGLCIVGKFVTYGAVCHFRMDGYMDGYPETVKSDSVNAKLLGQISAPEYNIALASSSYRVPNCWCSKAAAENFPKVCVV
jgi:hypothetical protein